MGSAAQGLGGDSTGATRTCKACRQQRCFGRSPLKTEEGEWGQEEEEAGPQSPGGGRGGGKQAPWAQSLWKPLRHCLGLPFHSDLV